MWMHGPYAGGFSFFMIIPLIFLFFCLLFVLRRVGRRGLRGGCITGMPGGRMRRHSANSAREVLDQRYARGEIDDAQYLKMKDALAS